MKYEKFIVDLFNAYYQARKNKRNKSSAIAFEIDYERKLFDLGKELSSSTYKIGQSICFISFKPLQREIFAADFRDRIVHHLIYNYIKSIFEKSFINDSYSCRIKKGTLYGVKRLDHFIRSCSDNYKNDCYVLKLDVKGYFMSIDKNILYKKVEEKINSYEGQKKFSSIWILTLIRQVIFHDPTENCTIKGKKGDWLGLPKSKSLFCVKKDKGLPIGNLTSQLLGNIYLDDFDHFVKYNLGCKYYGRYVDDIVVVHSDPKYLKSVIPLIRNYLKLNLELELHPRKIYLQSHKNGVSFLGAFLKSYRIYIRNRVKGNLYKNIRQWKQTLIIRGSNFDKNHQKKFLASINSYLGMLVTFQAYKLRRKLIIEYVLKDFNKFVYSSSDYRKILLKAKIKFKN